MHTRQKSRRIHDAGSVNSPDQSARPPGRGLLAVVCFLLAALVWVVFGQTAHHEFINFDDFPYITGNPVVQKGLTGEGFGWALTYGHIGHWHPLTWLSHMLDCQWFGLNPAGHHLINVLLHTASVLLLFLALRRMTGAFWRSAFVAAVFAIHPLRVESVAWVAERKDVLSAFFFMLTWWAYLKYVAAVRARQQLREQPRPGNPPPVPKTAGAVARYHALVIGCYALGLLSKNMLVTLPFVLLLLDHWPLRRWAVGAARPEWRPLILEKIPLFALAIASCVATLLVPEEVGQANRLALALRLENAAMSYVTYLWQMVHPVGLIPFYPNPIGYFPGWQVGGALALLLAISGAAWVTRKKHPYGLVGWLWFLGMSLPVIGLVQISNYAHADRYTYLPHIGLYLAITWAAVELSAGRRYLRAGLGGGAIIILALLTWRAREQTAYWRNNESLWTHTLACSPDNYLAQVNLHSSQGYQLAAQGRLAEAARHYETALQYMAKSSDRYYLADIHFNLGVILDRLQRPDEAVGHLQQAVEINPASAKTHFYLGHALAAAGRIDAAIPHYQTAIQLNPAYAEAYNDLANLLLGQGRFAEAIAQYQTAVRLQPDFAGALANLGAAQAAGGHFTEALATAQRALALAKAQTNPALADAVTQSIQLYQARASFPETPR